jgi:hypothetical protein
MLPELLEFVDERILQLVERRENDLGEVLAQMPEDLLGGIEFRTVGWQLERMHVLWPAHLTTTMTARTVQDHPDWTLSQLVAQMVQEELQALAFHGWQEEKDACPRGGFYRGIQPEPLVVVLHNPRGTFPQRTPAPTQPGDQAKAAFIQGHDALERRLLYQATEVFLKAACCSACAFLCRLRPVFHKQTMVLEEPPQRLAVLVANPPRSLQVITCIFQRRDVSRSHRLQQARPRLWGQPGGLTCWLLLLEQPCQALCPLAFPPAGQLNHAVAYQRRTILQTLHGCAFRASAAYAPDPLFSVLVSAVRDSSVLLHSPGSLLDT